jgi:hypothetical protein
MGRTQRTRFLDRFRKKITFEFSRTFLTPESWLVLFGDFFGNNGMWFPAPETRKLMLYNTSILIKKPLNFLR